MQDFVHQPYFGVPDYTYSIIGPYINLNGEHMIESLSQKKDSTSLCSFPATRT